MIRLLRTAGLPRVGASLSCFDALHSRFRIRVYRSRRVTLDEDVLCPNLSWSGPGSRVRLDLLLSGHARVRDAATQRWLEPGTFSVGSRLSNMYTRTSGDPLVMILCDWELGSLGTRVPEGTTGKLAPAEAGRLLQLAGALERAEPWALGEATVCLAETLRVLGAPFDVWSAGDLAEPWDPQGHVMANGLGATLSRLEDKPMLVDLETALGLTRRQVNRLVTTFADRYGCNGSSWRPMLERWRTCCAATLSTAPGARTEEIAQAVGYSNATVLCRTFQLTGLPSPGAMPRAVAASA